MPQESAAPTPYRPQWRVRRPRRNAFDESLAGRVHCSAIILGRRQTPLPFEPGQVEINVSSKMPTTSVTPCPIKPPKGRQSKRLPDGVIFKVGRRPPMCFHRLQAGSSFWIVRTYSAREANTSKMSLECALRCRARVQRENEAVPRCSSIFTTAVRFTVLRIWSGWPPESCLSVQVAAHSAFCGQLMVPPALPRRRSKLPLGETYGTLVLQLSPGSSEKVRSVHFLSLWPLRCSGSPLPCY